MLQGSEPAFEGDFVSVTYSGQPGEELPLHDHLFNHTMQVLEGAVEVFDGAGLVLAWTPERKPLEFAAGQPHGIRCVTAARFVNRSPSPGYLAEQAAL